MDSKDKLPTDDAQSSRRLHLFAGRKYRLTRRFSDADSQSHPVGEEWTFISSKFSRFEDEHIIFVRSASGATQSLGLIHDESEQYEMVRHFCEKISPSTDKAVGPVRASAISPAM